MQEAIKNPECSDSKPGFNLEGNNSNSIVGMGIPSELTGYARSISFVPQVLHTSHCVVLVG